MSKVKPEVENMPHPWKRAILWLLFLGSFFFLSYGFSNWITAQNSSVPSVVFDWERYIPFIPWTIIPYWIIDILYGISLFICSDSKELNKHCKRLLTAQLIAISCFLLFPLRFSFERPESSGISGGLFTALSSFDLPYNQAPSLHIALLIILWVLYLRHLPRILHLPFHILCFLIGISVLTTYQHHFIDIPTGALLGWLCVWLHPLEEESPFKLGKLATQWHHWKLAAYYFIGSILLSGIAFYFQGAALWLLWLAVSLLLVACNYIYFGNDGFQKTPDGHISIAAKYLYFPYLLLAFFNSRLWTWKNPKAVMICEGVYLGRFPSHRDIEISNYYAVIDMTAEFDKTTSNVNWYSFPCLDLLIPSQETLLKAAAQIAQLEKKGNILVNCALGYSRSALAIIAWLLQSKRAQNVDEAIEMLKRQRPAIVISNDAKMILAEIKDYSI